MADDAVADVLQDVRAKLLVDDRALAKLATYSARAPLKSWVRTSRDPRRGPSRAPHVAGGQRRGRS